MTRPHLPDTALAVTAVLTFVTGVVDAVGYLGLDRVFTGNMTGNIVILAMGLAGADELPVLGPLVALAAFAVGACAAGFVLREPPERWSSRITALLGTGALVLAALTAALVLAGEHDTPAVQVPVAAATAAVMGQQAMVARTLAVREMTTVVVTSTLTALAGESLVRGGAEAVWNRRLGAIAAIFLGAMTGAVLIRVHPAVPMGLAAALTTSAAAAGHRLLR
ncbi:YoaK family protein [Nocardia sp. NPDC057227]|uniref:YoaK family protein n=1 Tax=Nocardia sp. NPDC057227 TaxID=3346056 RepID=UPI00363870BA